MAFFKGLFPRAGAAGLGFEARELMEGTHVFVGGAGPTGEHLIRFEVTWGTRDLRTWLNPRSPEFMTNFLRGTITAGGLVEKAPCQGVLELRYFTESKIRYRFEFQAEGAKRYRYVGEKVDIRPWNLHRTHTTCYGTITEIDSGREISRSIVYFRLSQLPRFLASFRLRHND